MWAECIPQKLLKVAAAFLHSLSKDDGRKFIDMFPSFEVCRIYANKGERSAEELCFSVFIVGGAPNSNIEGDARYIFIVAGAVTHRSAPTS
jgi:hypothetical protein